MESIWPAAFTQLKFSLTSSRWKQEMETGNGNRKWKQEMETGNGTQKMNNEIRKLLYSPAVCNVLPRFNLVSSVPATWYPNSLFLHKETH